MWLAGPRAAGVMSRSGMPPKLSRPMCQPEGWPSGLRRTPGKRVGVSAPRGFESRSLRHFRFPYVFRELHIIPIFKGIHGYTVLECAHGQPYILTPSVGHNDGQSVCLSSLQQRSRRPPRRDCTAMAAASTCVSRPADQRDGYSEFRSMAADAISDWAATRPFRSPRHACTPTQTALQ